jgi:beta-glucosidase
VILKFPKNFYWGTATSAYQVEGGIRNDWSVAGKKFDAGRACDHYHRFEEDFDLAKAMNNNAHRFSIEWARIEPEQGKFDQKEIEHYRRVILALRERGLEPFITLYHWTLPVWFAKKGGWLNKDAPEYFERFVEKIVGEYKDLVKFWITLNEPNVYVSQCFFRGNWPPFIKNWFKAQGVFKQLIKAHIKAYETIRKISPFSRIGIATNNIWYRGIVKLFADYKWNHKFLKAIKDYQNFIGLNYYFSHSLVKFFLKREEVSDLGWRIVPQGIYYVLKDLKKYNKAIFITENGLADAQDKKRAKFIIDHLKWIHKAIEEGIDVRGYFHWSLIDNFEWDKGFKPRFGLVEIDYKTLQRIPRPSSKIYAQICKNNSLDI